jgi:hypothetical protein
MIHMYRKVVARKKNDGGWGKGETVRGERREWEKKKRGQEEQEGG